MGLFDSIFGTPNKDAAEAKQANLMHNQLSLGNQLHNKGTTGKIMQELSIQNYGKTLSNMDRAITHAQSKAFKTAESIARVRALRGKVNTGGRSTRFGDNQNKMLLSQLAKAETFLRYSQGEKKGLVQNAALRKYQSDFSKANAMIGVGVGAKRGITYTKDNNALKFAKLAISVATSDFGGMIQGADPISGDMESMSLMRWLARGGQ